MTQSKSQTGIDKCIKKLNDFFVAEIMEGKYEVKEISNCTAVILTASGKEFCLWIANKEDSFKPYEGDYSFMAIEFNKKEQKILHARFREHYNTTQKKKEFLELKKRYEKLKPEFE